MKTIHLLALSVICSLMLPALTRADDPEAQPSCRR